MAARQSWYFDGYKAKIEEDENGKEHKVLYYVGQYYGFRKTKEETRRIKIHCFLCFAVMVCAYLYAQLTPDLGGMNRWIGYPSILAIVPMIFMVIGLVMFLISKEKWKIREYYGGYRRLYRWGIAELVILAFWVFMEVLFIILNPLTFVTELHYLIAAALSLAADIRLIYVMKQNRVVVVQGPTRE